MNSNLKIAKPKNKLGLAVTAALLASSLPAIAQDEEQMIEEVVVKASRLKGTASAVLQERQDQAFVADIMGADQISRTGDGDAASALRRVTGLTLVDGKFIYVRGLGERYSSTQLNSMVVPSPDPTRSVVPLDLFPSDVIESLSVQKSYSPNMPAHFGGGNVDIRTKSMPNDFLFKMNVSSGYNTNQSDDGYFYEGGNDDWMGKDDGTRALPTAISEAFNTNGASGIENPGTAEATRELLSSLDWEVGPKKESADPSFGFGVTLGNKYDLDTGAWGYLFAISYDNKWAINNEANGDNLIGIGSDKERFAQSYDGVSMEHNVRWSGMFNFGYEYNKDHKFELVNIALHDMSDRVRNRTFVDDNETEPGLLELRKVDVLFEEREMYSTQLKGKHNFPELSYAYLDWYYGKSRANRDAPGGIEAVFETDVPSGVEQLQDVSAAKIDRTYQQLRDDSETWGGNFTYPVTGDGWEAELKVGADFSEKKRTSQNLSFGIAHFQLGDSFIVGSHLNDIFSDENIATDGFFNSSTGAGVLTDGTSDGDKYAALNKNDAYYFMADFFLSNTWRISGGVRYEDFQQIAVPYLKHSSQFQLDTQGLSEAAFIEDDFFPSLAITYIMDETMQFRFNVGETAIRPDFRDISRASYIDPLTEFEVTGTPLLESSTMKHVDLRWEWYREDGNNISVALFYKDIQNPIETVELPSVGGATPQLMTTNGKEGELTGIEFEFLQDFNFIDLNNWFLSGNITLSDSEVDLGASDEGSLIEQQVENAGFDFVDNFVTNNKRRLIGHSEWVANLQLGYDSDNGNHAASVVYNVFGPRIIVPGARTAEDAEEESFHSLDVVYTYYPSFNSTLKFKVKNVFNEDKEITQNGLTKWSKEVGTSFDVSYSYEF